MSKEEKIVFCTGGGCTAKLGAGVLSRILEKLPRGEKDPDLLVGYDSRDDAAVYRITDDIAFVQTVDFFPPMVDDPYTFGQIAAANALSDIYAMGGEVKTALNLVCFPESMDLNILGEILRGGCRMASFIYFSCSVNGTSSKLQFFLTIIQYSKCRLQNQ